jgi:hypothetical protein
LCPRNPKAPPSMAPMNTEGPKTPPLPPELIVQEVARILSSARSPITHQRIFPSMAIWIHPYPPSRTAGERKEMTPSISPPRAGFSIRLIGRGLKNLSRRP